MDLGIPPALTPVSDAKPVRQTLEEDDSDDESDVEEIEPSADGDDVVMTEENKESEKVDDWHLREPTARPEYISQRLNKRIPSFYKVCSTR
jgi:hypothetical protein